MTPEESWLLNEKWRGEKTAGFFTDCDRLKSGEPLAYIIDHIPFLNTNIWLDSRPLIPRPETEYWVQKVIEKMTQNQSLHQVPIRVLDLCAGSGCIGVAILNTIPNTYVDFVEIDTDHHGTILKNITANGIDASRAHILGGDLFEYVDGQYDFILSNPPYIDTSLGRVERSVIEYEPDIALYAEDGGLQVLNDIIRQGEKYLKTTGTLVIEHEPEQCSRIHQLAQEYSYKGYTQLDQYGIERFTILTPFLNSKTQTNMDKEAENVEE